MQAGPFGWGNKRPRARVRSKKKPARLLLLLGED
jgi:hypothetical protein